MGRQLLFAVALVATILLSMCLTPETNFFMSSPPKILTPLGTPSPSPAQTSTTPANALDKYYEDIPVAIRTETSTPLPTEAPAVMAITPIGRVGTSELTRMLSSAANEGKLYVGTGNPVTGGRVYRYDGGTAWTDVGQLGNARYVYALALYGGKLYGGTNFGRVYRYDGGTTWTDVGRLGSDMPVHSLAVYDGKLYGGTATGRVYRYDGGTAWTDAGELTYDTRVSSLALYGGKLYGGIGPFGKVYRYDGGTKWTGVGQLGEDVEVSSLLVYGGKLYGRGHTSGTAYLYDDGTAWSRVGPFLPDTSLRSLAVYDGKLYGGGSGRIFSDEVPGLVRGAVYRYDGNGTAWTRVAVFRSGDTVSFLAVSDDGKLYAALENSNEMYSIGK